MGHILIKLQVVITFLWLAPSVVFGQNLVPLGSYPGLDFANDIVASGTTVYMTVWPWGFFKETNQGGLWIFDVEDPNQPEKLAQFIPEVQYGAQVLDVSDKVAYISAHNGGSELLEAVDVSDPAHCDSLYIHHSVIDCFPPSYCSWEDKQIQISGDQLFLLVEMYAGDWTEFIHGSSVTAYDISDPSHPNLEPLSLGTGEDGASTGFTVSGSLILLSGDNTGLPNGLHIYETSPDPAHPVRLASLETPGNAHKVVLYNSSTALIADGPAGFTLVDFHNPSQPTLLTSLALPGEGSNVTVTGAMACISMGENGVALVDIADPLQPKLAGSYDTEGQSQQTVFEAGHAYIADGTNGLVIMGYTGPETGPTVTPTQTPLVSPTPTHTPIPPSTIIEWKRYQ